MNLFIVSLLFILNSCTLFNPSNKLTTSKQAFNQICLDANGAGRIFLDKQTYVFNYESAFFKEDLKFAILMNFPLYGQEKFEMVWNLEQSKASYDASYENLILKNGSDVDINVFKHMSYVWKRFYQDYLASKNLIKTEPSDWSILKGKELVKEYKFKSNLVRFHFSNQKSEGYFGKLIMNYYKSGNKHFGLEFIVRNCM